MASLDLFTLFVSYIFGSIFLSMFGLAFIYFIIGVMGKMTVESILVVILFFMGVFMVGYFGGGMAAIVFLIACWYFISNAINWWNSARI